jgi:L-seryl-tRNA(Ser) seleniumtransferase
MKPGKNDLRSLPAVDTLLDDPHIVAHIRQYGRPLTVEAVRAALADARSAIQSGSTPPDEDKSPASCSSQIERLAGANPDPGDQCHRGGAAHQPGTSAAQPGCTGRRAPDHRAYSTLEYQLESGQRGSRAVHAERLLVRLTGAEAALVVNNNAAAVMLALAALWPTAAA